MPPSPFWERKSDMLTVAKSMGQLRFSQLAEVYETETLEAEQALYDFLRHDFFPNGICCLWEEKGRYVAALRLQPWKDGWLLEGLQTHRDHRRKGYAKALVTAALQMPGMEKVYVHIQRQNGASVALHRACGFCKLWNYATYLDGSVYHSADTYLYEKQAAD